MRQLLSILFLAVVVSGCQTLGMKLNDEHAKTHNVEIQLGDSVKNVLKSIDVTHRLYEGNVDLFVGGYIRKPFTVSASSRATVNAKFLDDSGQVIIERSDSVMLRRLGRGALRRKQEGSFLLQIPDNPRIVKCILELKNS